MFAAQKIGSRKLYWLLLTGLSLTLGAAGQGTFIYDQQSGDESTGNGPSLAIQAFPPFGQSFTPLNSTIGFVRLNCADNQPGNNTGATVQVNLHSDSITGPIVDSTTPVLMPDNFGRGSLGFVNFFFPTPVSVTPGLTYYFEVVVLSGDPWSLDVYTYRYPGGVIIESGIPAPPSSSVDMWFREGIVVPEPSSLTLLIGSGVLFYVGRKKIKMRSRT